MRAAMLAGVLLLFGEAMAQPVPENLPHKFGTKTERLEAETCSSQNGSCTAWCSKNNATSNTCTKECDWRIDYCRRTGLYPQQTRPSVWVGKRD